MKAKERLAPVIAGKTIRWKVRERMVAAKIPSVSELHRKMRALDPETVCFAQFADIIDVPPARLNLRTLLGLALVLECKIEDVMDVGPAQQGKKGHDDHA